MTRESPNVIKLKAAHTQAAGLPWTGDQEAEDTLVRVLQTLDSVIEDLKSPAVVGKTDVQASRLGVNTGLMEHTLGIAVSAVRSGNTIAPSDSGLHIPDSALRWNFHRGNSRSRCPKCSELIGMRVFGHPVGRCPLIYGWTLTTWGYGKQPTMAPYEVVKLLMALKEDRDLE